MRFPAVLAVALALSGCAGVPIGHHTSLFVGVGVVRVDKAGLATAISSRSLGASFGCELTVVGLQASYCVHIPIDGDVAILERGDGTDQRLSVKPLKLKENVP